VQPLDALLIEGTNLLPTDPIAGVFGVDTDGSVNFGLVYGKVQVAGLTLEEAKAAIEKQLRTIVKKPDPTSPGPVVQVSLAATAGLQQIRGEHLVRPDGTVSLGTYGSVYVTGLTMSEAKAAIEAQLSTTLVRPEVVVDVFSYNSKVYYVITDNGGFGEQIIRLPITGNETVLDALANIGGLPATASKHRIWIARPSPSHGGGESCDDQILAVDYPAMTRCANTATNYQIFPGDRLYVQADPLIKLDGILTKIITPIERVLGFALFSDRAIIAIQNKNNGGNGGGAGLGGF
jgi:polysaccharide export outer membrane protein